jgi:hypothetical protein
LKIDMLEEDEGQQIIYNELVVGLLPGWGTVGKIGYLGAKFTIDPCNDGYYSNISLSLSSVSSSLSESNRLVTFAYNVVSKVKVIPRLIRQPWVIYSTIDWTCSNSNARQDWRLCRYKWYNATS